MYTLHCVVDSRLRPSPSRIGLLPVLALVLLTPQPSRAQAQPTGRADSIPIEQGKPNPVAADQHGLPVLDTIRVHRDRATFRLSMVDASPLPREKRDMSMLEFAYRPLRVRTVDIPGKGRRPVHYLYYKVVNRTGAPRIFAPQFIMVNDKGERFEANLVPRAIPEIQVREDPTIPLLGGTAIKGILPPSTNPDVDVAVYGVAIWEEWDHNADRIRIYVRGLSDGHEEIPSPRGRKRLVKYRTLKIDFIREGKLQLADPPHEWVHW